MGTILKMGEQQEIIPAIQNGTAMEYALSTSIKKMTVVDKPSIGLIQGYGSPTWNDLAQVYQSLSILYNPEPLDLNSADPIPERFRTIALVAPSAE